MKREWNVFDEGRTFGSPERAHVAQSVEHVLGKDEVTGSIPVVGSRMTGAPSTEAPAAVVGKEG